MAQANWPHQSQQTQSNEIERSRHQTPDIQGEEIEGVCEGCQFGKQHRHPFPKERNVSKGLLDVVHSDVWGPAQTATFSGCGYYVDFSRHTWIYPMRNKSEVFGHFQKFKSEVEKAIGQHVRCLRSDGGKEYFSDDFTAYLRRKEFSENSLAATLHNKTVYPSAKIGISSK